MKNYLANDGTVIRATDARGVVRKLRGASNTPERSIQEFMNEVAARVLGQGLTVPTDTPAHFVAGLIEAGLLTEESE